MTGDRFPGVTLKPRRTGARSSAVMVIGIAVYEGEVAELCAFGATLAAAPDPAEALFGWLESLAGHVVTKGALAFTGTGPHTDRRTALFDRWHASIRATADQLFDRARAQGSIREDLTVSDVLALTSAAATAANRADDARRLIGLIRHGMESRHDH
ncbi:SbtR family transcriptional regulator [Glycomyces rhizosphaerae]|uniref:Transcriptional regulator SbtR-like C-terminal domain-containing protein n=1 Tax=Glycomyces rhizosphaerae TaxID=2054422 RepID=A0ABV7PVX8_9ACTN